VLLQVVLGLQADPALAGGGLDGMGQPVAEVVVRVASLSGPEDVRCAVAAGLFLGLLKAFQGGVDDLPHPLGHAAHGGFHGLGEDGRQGVVAGGVGDAPVEEGAGVRLGDVHDLPGGGADEVLFELNEHDGSSK
jgi:hypothetical protein